MNSEYMRNVHDDLTISSLCKIFTEIFLICERITISLNINTCIKKRQKIILSLLYSISSLFLIIVFVQNIFGDIE